MRKVQTHDHFLRRRAGVLLHPSSLQVDAGHGVLGQAATRFIDFLVQSGFSIWQMLPVQAVDDFASPYQCVSSHAGNPGFICEHKIRALSWMNRDGWRAEVDSSAAPVDFMSESLLRFSKFAPASWQDEYTQFKASHAHWLHDYALFCVIKAAHKNQPWWEWPGELRRRDRLALDSFRAEHVRQIERYCFEQFVFFSQWRDVQCQARDKNILLFGDMPMFIAHDSVDVWVNPSYFQLDGNGHPTVVAGVPPDYFSATGQRWGNPVYNWEAIGRDNYHWWLERMKTQFELFDLVRLDHFRGYEATWEIPAASATAVQGEWQPVPGHALFEVMYQRYGDLPLVAEDLGIISTAVTRLRDDFMLPGMKVLQFAFDSDAKNPYLPHHHLPVGLVCTGTHDNNTSLGWFDELDEAVRERLQDYLQHPVESMPWPLIREALASVACIAVIPMQDLLGLDASHRMNTPGTTAGNWQWQFAWDAVSAELPAKLMHLNRLYDRC